MLASCLAIPRVTVSVKSGGLRPFLVSIVFRRNTNKLSAPYHDMAWVVDIRVVTALGLARSEWA